MDNDLENDMTHEHVSRLKLYAQMGQLFPERRRADGKYQQVLDNSQSTAAALVPQTQTLQFGQAVCLENTP